MKKTKVKKILKKKKEITKDMIINFCLNEIGLDRYEIKKMIREDLQ